MNGEIITVNQLIEELQKVENKELPVYVYSVGVTASSSWKCPIETTQAVTEIDNNRVDINFMNI